MALYFIQPKQIVIPQTFLFYIMILSFTAYYAVFPHPRIILHAPLKTPYSTPDGPETHRGTTITHK